MKNYSVSIQSNDHSISLCDFDTKAEAVKYATASRGGRAYAGDFSASESPSVSVRNNTTEEEIYNQPLFKRALKQ